MSEHDPIRGCKLTNAESLYFGFRDYITSDEEICAAISEIVNEKDG